MSVPSEFTAPIVEPREGGTLSNWESVELCETLATLIAAGLPLPAGLRAMGAEHPSRKIRAALLDAADRVEAGEAIEAVFGDPVDRKAVRLPTYLRRLVLAGARSGRIGEVLTEYARHARVGVDLKRRILLNACYPIILTLMLALAFQFVCANVVLGFDDIAKSFGAQLPMHTELILDAARFTATHGSTILLDFAGMIVTIILAWRFLLRPSERSRTFHAIPVIGPTFRFGATSLFCRHLAMLLDHEVPLPLAVESAGSAAGDAEFTGAGERLRSAIEKGRTLREAMLDWPKCPAGLAQLLVDESSGSALADSLRFAGDLFETRASSQAEYASAVISTISVFILFWGLGFLIAAVTAPIFVMTRLLF